MFSVRDNPGAFLHADMNGTVHMIFKVMIAELIENQRCVEYIYGKTRLEAFALYAKLQTTLLFW